MRRVSEGGKSSMSSTALGSEADSLAMLREDAVLFFFSIAIDGDGDGAAAFCSRQRFGGLGI